MNPTASLFSVALTLFVFAGCTSIGSGITEREWREAWDSLQSGITPQEVLTALGDPREKLPTTDATASAIDQTWIYTRPEVVGYRTTKTGEHDIQLPNQRVISVPYYGDEEVRVIAIYRLQWAGDRLVAWARTEE